MKKCKFVIGGVEKEGTMGYVPDDDGHLTVPVGVIVESMDDGHNVKCPRCWHWHGVIENFDNLCDRCCKIILTDYKHHPSVPHIRAAVEAQAKKYGFTQKPAWAESSPS